MSVGLACISQPKRLHVGKLSLTDRDIHQSQANSITQHIAAVRVVHQKERSVFSSLVSGERRP